LSFDHLGLTPELLRAVAAEGYVQPTPVQAEAIPLILSGRDVLAGAQTGTGKTAAFVLPILQHLHRDDGDPGGPGGHGGPAARRQPGLGSGSGSSRRRVRALVLAPTRELALQVEHSIRVYGAHRPVRSTPIYGGVGFEPQVRALRAGPEIVVATPGRLLDHVAQGTIDLSHVEILVLDEADRMLDMGFIRDIRRILHLLPDERQSLLFSATFSDPIRQLAGNLLDRPALVQVAPRNQAAELVDQIVYAVDRHRKRALLSHLVRSDRIDQALVFTRTKHGANRLAEQLHRDGIAVAAIHGNKSQPQRIRALDDFKQGRSRVLVATDIAARGLDIDGLPHVVNFELPTVPEDYVHRIGRTGRAGAVGEAISLVAPEESLQLRDIERLLRRPIRSETIRGFEPLGATPPIAGVPLAVGAGSTPRTPRTPRAPGRRPRPGAVPRAGGGRRAPDLGRRETSLGGLVAMPGERLARLGGGPAGG
jgi:ATP-dependent RNA helicase RhlE